MTTQIPRKILLNPGPVTTTDTVKQAQVVPDICHREHEFTSLIQKIRSDLLKVVHAKDDYTAVLFGASGTGALEACLSSVIPEGKKVLIVNNGSYGERLVSIAKRHHIEVVELTFTFDQELPLEKIESILADDEAIHSCVLVHHETSTGILNPLREMGAICKRTGKQFIVDAMSSYAGVPIDVYQDNIDYLISSSNKCLHGMPGLSFVICNKARVLETQNNARTFYFDLYKQYSSVEKTGEMPFTPPVQAAYALNQALDEYFAQTGAKRFAQFRSNYTQLRQGLETLGFEVVTPEARQSYLLMTVCNPKGSDYNFNHIHDYLFERGYTIYPKKLSIPNTFRLACIGDLTPEDIDNFLSELKQYQLMCSESLQQVEE